LRILQAEVKDGKLHAEGIEPSDINILSQAEADSSGVLVLDNDQSIYITNTQPDLQTSINKLIAVCEQFTAICNTELMLGGTGSAPLKPFEGQGEAVDSIKKELEEFTLK
jgi:hypothetical protein